MIRAESHKITILSLVFLCGTIHPMAQDPVPGALLWLDAAQSEGTGQWKNLGTAGGSMNAAGTPLLEPAGRGEPARYTPEKRGDVFGGPHGTPPVFRLGKAWTIELWLKRNGPAYSDEHWVASFQALPDKHVQGIRIMVGKWSPTAREDSGNIHVYIKGKDSTRQWFHTPYLNIGLKKWCRIALVHKEADGRLQMYKNDRMVGEFKSNQNFDPDMDIRNILIFTDDWQARHRTFNGSIAIVRVYDRALSDVELLANLKSDMSPTLAVEHKIVNPGEQFTVDISAYTTDIFPQLQENHVYRLGFDLTFEPTVLQAIGVKSNVSPSVDNSEKTVRQRPQANIVNETGAITSLECYHTGKGNESKDVAVLSVVTFKAIKTGSSKVGLQNLQPLEPSGKAIAARVRAGRVDVFRHGGISGVVKDSQDQKPISRVKIEVLKNGFAFGAFAYSDDEGKYVLNGVPVGNFEVVASKFPYLPTTLETDVEQGEMVPNINFNMKPILSSKAKDRQK